MRKKLIAVAVAGAFALAERLGLVQSAVQFELTKEEHAKLPKDVQALYVEKEGKLRLDGVEIEDTGGLKSALEKERAARKTAEKAVKDLAAQWEGLDPAEIRSLVAKLGGDAESQLIKAGKIDEVVALRTEKLRKEHEKQMKAAADSIAKAAERSKKFEQRVLDNAVRAAVTKAGVHPGAVEDALFRARTIFTVNDEGEAIQLKDGEPVLGKDAKTPFSPAEWVEGMKEAAPHWFGSPNAGGGARGSGAQQGKTMKRADFDAITDPAAKSKAAKDFAIVD